LCEELSPVDPFLAVNSLDETKDFVRNRVGIEMSSDVLTVEFSILQCEAEWQPVDCDVASRLHFG